MVGWATTAPNGLFEDTIPPLTFETGVNVPVYGADAVLTVPVAGLYVWVSNSGDWPGYCTIWVVTGLDALATVFVDGGVVVGAVVAEVVVEGLATVGALCPDTDESIDDSGSRPLRESERDGLDAGVDAVESVGEAVLLNEYPCWLSVALSGGLRNRPAVAPAPKRPAPVPLKPGMLSREGQLVLRLQFTLELVEREFIAFPIIISMLRSALILDDVVGRALPFPDVIMCALFVLVCFWFFFKCLECVGESLPKMRL